ncbi:sarcosine oxidase subunit delta, partial [Pseudomonas aeruginosa]
MCSYAHLHAKGHAHIPRPLDQSTSGDEEWGDYIFSRDNPRGLQPDLWVHAADSRKYFNGTRHT